jgi:hypothetical protein
VAFLGTVFHRFMLLAFARVDIVGQLAEFSCINPQANGMPQI